MLHSMRQTRAGETVIGEAVFQDIEVCETLDHYRYICVVGHAMRSDVQEQLWDKGTNDSEGNPELAQAAL
jgi:hypothetical protein